MTTTPDGDGLEALFMQDTGFRTDTSAALRLSTWTVIGSVFASVLTASLLGGVSGILQIPTLVNQVSTLVAARESGQVTQATMSERVRSAELSIEGLQRQLNDASTRAAAMAARQDTMGAAESNLDISTQRQISDLEGRSKDRNTQALAAAATIQTGLNDQNEKLRLVIDQVSALRANVYDLAIRANNRPSPSNLTGPSSQELRPSGPPASKERDSGFVGHGTQEATQMVSGQSPEDNFDAIPGAL
jgi:hypothetical protein